MKRIFKRILCFMLCFTMIMPFMGYSNANAEEGNVNAYQGDYFNQYATHLFDSGILKCDRDDIEMTADKKSGSLIISGSNINGSLFTVDKEYVFDGNIAGRFSLDATSAKGSKVKLAFYLDDNEEPFAEKVLYKQKKKGVWTYSKDYSCDISDLKIYGKHKVSFKVTDAEDGEVSFSIKSFEFAESSVPVIYFNIDEEEGTIAEMNASYDHSVECYGSMTIDVPEGYVSEYTGEELKSNTYELEYIRGRGNSTWDCDKKPYKIKLDKKADLLGLGKNKHWVLLANSLDNSLLRNKITYWLGEKWGMEYTPQSEPVDVVMNGEYYGSYFLCEQVRVGESRVEIDNLEDSKEASDLPEITGGYLLSMFPDGNDESKVTIKTKRDKEFLIESPEFDSYSNDAQVEYITKYIQDTEDAIFGSDFKNSEGVSYTELMDIVSTAKYYWIQELSKNGDGYCSGSTYLYKPRNDKLYWGPLWDFDYVAWGSTEYDTPDTKGWVQNGDYNEEDFKGRLFTDKVFAQEVVDLWPELREYLNELVKPGGQLDKYKEKMNKTAAYNFEKWGMTDFSWDEEKTDSLTYDQEIERLRTWITERMTWIDSHVQRLVPEPTTVTFKTYKGEIIGQYEEIIGQKLKNIPQAPKRKGYCFSGWTYKYTMTFEDYLNEIGYGSEEEMIQELKEYGYSEEEISEMIEEIKNNLEGEGCITNTGTAVRDMVLTATYVKESEVVPVKDIKFSRNTYIAIYDEDGYYSSDLDFQITPFDATFTDLKWESSDETVVTIDDYGNMAPTGNGTAYITVTASNGVSKSVKVVVVSYKDVDNGDYEYSYMTSIESSITISKGEYKQLSLYCGDEEKTIAEGTPYMIAADTDILELGQAGVIHGLKAGVTYVICVDQYHNVSICKVTVKDNAIKKGSVVKKNGIKYEVTSNAKNSRTVKVTGLSNTGKTKVVIPSSIKINNKSYKVTAIKSSAFKNKKKIKSAIIGKNVEIIGKSAFYGCSNLSKVTIKAHQAKVYKSSFKKINKKAKFYVPVKEKKYYNIVLKGKEIKVKK